MEKKVRAMHASGGGGSNPGPSAAAPCHGACYDRAIAPCVVFLEHVLAFRGLGLTLQRAL